MTETPIKRTARQVSKSRYLVPGTIVTKAGEKIEGYNQVTFKANNMRPPTGNREAARRLKQEQRNNVK